MIAELKLNSKKKLFCIFTSSEYQCQSGSYRLLFVRCLRLDRLRDSANVSIKWMRLVGRIVAVQKLWYVNYSRISVTTFLQTVENHHTNERTAGIFPYVYRARSAGLSIAGYENKCLSVAFYERARSHAFDQNKKAAERAAEPPPSQLITWSYAPHRISIAIT